MIDLGDRLSEQLCIVKLGFLTVLVHDCYQEEFQSMDIYSKGSPTKGLLADDTHKRRLAGARAVDTDVGAKTC